MQINPNDAPVFVVQGTRRACLTALNAVYGCVRNIDREVREWYRCGEFNRLKSIGRPFIRIIATHIGGDLGHTEHTWELRVYHKDDFCEM